MKIYFSGQRTFGNRGCEALVRSTAHLVRAVEEDATILVPSDDQSVDLAQWPEMASDGVSLVHSFPSPIRQRLFTLAASKAPQLFAGSLGHMPIGDGMASDIRSCDAVFSIGGDMYSLDYGLPTRITSIDSAAVRMGKPVFLWCASVGPFNASPAIERVMVKHLSQFSTVVVREEISEAYLNDLGLENVILAADPAFHLGMESFQSAFITNSQRPLIGLNLSPIAEKIASEAGVDLWEEAAKICDHFVGVGNSVVLVPHVTPLGKANLKNDHATLQKVLEKVAPQNREFVELLNARMNAAQLKWAISKCRIFVGARTHSTIAALSNKVPTLSLKYSIKAEGINRRLFGDDRYVLPLADFSSQTVIAACERLDAERDVAIAKLEETLPLEREKGRAAMRHCLAQV